MAWKIECSSPGCGKEFWAENIDVLLRDHRDSHGWFLCQCGKPTGFIRKEFELQEDGETWAPFLRGAIKLGTKGDTYQPFVFMVSYEHDGPVTDMWFSYFKDTRNVYPDGRLKLGYGPGGPPVLGLSQVFDLVNALIASGVVSADDVRKRLGGGGRESQK
jgi:hypothetical protein